VGASAKFNAFWCESVAETDNFVVLNDNHDVGWVATFFKEALGIVVPTAGKFSPDKLNDCFLLSSRAGLMTTSVCSRNLFSTSVGIS